MIRRLTSLDEHRAFIADFVGDPVFSDPMLATAEELELNLLRAVSKPNDHVLGVYEGGCLTGLFVFLILPEERYLEMIVGLSRAAAAYEEIAAWLEAECPGYQADFVFNPANPLLRSLLARKRAAFLPEQRCMVLAGPTPAADTAGVEPLSAPYLAQYLALHGTDAYWTGEKVVAAPERFRVLLAIEDGAVVGYLDVTNCFAENEPYDLFVRPEHRRRGWGRKLMAAAIERNRPNGMMLLVDADNAPAIRLYESLGFAPRPDRNNLTATWHIA